MFSEIAIKKSIASHSAAELTGTAHAMGRGCDDSKFTVNTPSLITLVQS